jgi:hypothetical protein
VRRQVDVQATGSGVASRVAAIRRAQSDRGPGSRLDPKTIQRLAALAKAIPGIPRVKAFLSYDLPRQAAYPRRLCIAALRRGGFERMHQSFYIGPAERLRGILESLEPYELLPRLQWGTLTLFSH